MKTILQNLAWRLKIGWECVGGHSIDASGCHTCGKVAVAYRYVWMHRKTHQIRFQDKPQTPISL